MPTKPQVDLDSLETRVGALEGQMREVLSKAAFKNKTAPGVCSLGINPSSDCPSGSLGRWQSGCRGEACTVKQRKYYKDYRARTKGAPVPAPVKVTVQKKASAPKRAEASAEKKASSPVKRTVKRRSV